VLFVTPEYNRSVPAVLKNALDVGSRPYGSSVWDRKPGAIVSSSPGAIAGFGAKPEAYLSHVDKLFDEYGKLVIDGTGKFLQDFMQAFAKWVETILSPVHLTASSEGGPANEICDCRRTGTWPH
jgi:chromate reductase